MDKFKLIGKNRTNLDPIHLPNPGNKATTKTPQQQQQQVKLYDRINLKSKLKEHLYSPLHFETEKMAYNIKYNQGQRLKNLNYPRDDFVRDKREFRAEQSNLNKKVHRTGKWNCFYGLKISYVNQSFFGNLFIDMVRCKQLYFKSNMTAASTTYDECNYAKSINTINSGDETDNAKTDYDDGEYCSKNCNCNISEDDYYDYEDENNHYEEHNYNEYHYNEQFENEYDDVDYETNEEHEIPIKVGFLVILENLIEIMWNFMI